MVNFSLMTESYLLASVYYRLFFFHDRKLSSLFYILHLIFSNDRKPLRNCSWYLFCHVLNALTCHSATFLCWDKTLVLAFVMSRTSWPAILPHISTRKRPLCLFLSCPGRHNLPFCHRFRQGKDPCAPFCHVPGVITCHSATFLCWEKTLVPPFIMSRTR